MSKGIGRVVVTFDDLLMLDECVQEFVRAEKPLQVARLGAFLFRISTDAGIEFGEPEVAHREFSKKVADTMAATLSGGPKIGDPEQPRLRLVPSGDAA